MGDEASRALALLRAQRHSLMNHLQVVSGWLQLGRNDRALQHIARVAARMEAESQVLRRLDSPEAALLVIAIGLEAEAAGVALDWRVDGPVDLALLPDAEARIRAAIGRAARLPEAERRLVICLGSPIAVHTPSAAGEG